MATVYIAEDDSNILEIETFALSNIGLTVQGFDKAAPLFAALAEKVPDLFLLDIMLPGEDGLQILKKIRSNPKTARVPVIMVTAKSAEVDIVRGLDQGADDYITKPFGIMELISRVKALLRRSSPQQAQEAISLDRIFLYPDKRACTADGVPVSLTYKEFELLEFLLRNTGIVLKRELLLERIWGINYEGETRTLDQHIKTLRQKLGESGNHIKTIRNVGYMIS